MSQGQFMAGAAQMASRPASLLSTAMGMHLRPQQQVLKYICRLNSF